MGRGAPNKKGLDYFPMMTDFFENDRIFDLLDRYGPLGVTAYICILCIVYKCGYYAEIPLDKLSRMIVKMIGNKWVKNKKAVVQVVHYCSEIGLIDDDLMTKNIITSVGIQKRFHKVAVKLMKRRLYDDRYWLLKNVEDGEPLESAPKKRNPSEENRISSEINRQSSEESTIKEKKNKEYIYAAAPDKPFDNPELEKAFQFFLTCRKHNGAEFIPEQVQVLREELLSVADTNTERIASAKKAAVSGWKSFYPEKGSGKQKKQQAQPQGKNRFNNFKQRDYDYGELERQLLEAGGQNGQGSE